ncbi:hypothetical protein RIF29_08566 [Crotalaria pallida]|uniref:ENTH domain-containing protein n=1 Tax=Crotalaria pallida TaxID=3830 RepID=A0AAN9FQZ9_CROPI
MTKLKELIGIIKDKASQGKAAILSKRTTLSLLRATSHDSFTPPSHKHISTLLSSGDGSRATASAAIDLLMDRLQTTRNSAVALKCLITVHHIIKHGTFIFQDQLSVYPYTGGRNYLNMSNFRDKSTPTSWELSSYVRWYAQHMEQLLSTSRILGFFMGTSESGFIAVDDDMNRRMDDFGSGRITFELFDDSVYTTSMNTMNVCKSDSKESEFIIHVSRQMDDNGSTWMTLNPSEDSRYATSSSNMMNVYKSDCGQSRYSTTTIKETQERVSGLTNGDLLSEMDSLLELVEGIGRRPSYSSSKENKLVDEIVGLVEDDGVVALTEVYVRVNEFRERVGSLSFGEGVELVCCMKRLEDCKERMMVSMLEMAEEQRLWDSTRELKERVYREEGKVLKMVTRHRASESDRFAGRVQNSVVLAKFPSSRFM